MGLRMGLRRALGPAGPTGPSRPQGGRAERPAGVRRAKEGDLGTWYAELREFKPEIPCVLVANKIDADIKIIQKSFSFARKFSLPLYFVSAADGTNVVKLFNDSIRLAVSYEQNSPDFMDEVLQELKNIDLELEEEEYRPDQEQEQEQRGCPESPAPSLVPEGGPSRPPAALQPAGDTSLCTVSPSCTSGLEGPAPASTLGTGKRSAPGPAAG